MAVDYFGKPLPDEQVKEEIQRFVLVPNCFVRQVFPIRHKGAKTIQKTEVLRVEEKKVVVELKLGCYQSKDESQIHFILSQWLDWYLKNFWQPLYEIPLADGRDVTLFGKIC